MVIEDRPLHAERIGSQYAMDVSRKELIYYSTSSFSIIVLRMW